MATKVLVTLFVISLISILAAGTIAEEKVKTIIVFKDNPTQDDISFLKNQGAVVRYQYNIIPGLSLELPIQAVNRINEMCSNPKNPATPKICSNIESIEPDHQVSALSRPAPSQPAQTLPWGIKRVGADLSWVKSTGKGIKIAVVDTGIDYTHTDLDANVKDCVTFVTGTSDCKDDNGHGTHVAGTIAAENNSIGVVGVAPDAWLYGVKVLNRKGSGWTSDVIAGIDWSNSNGMQVITMSLGSSFDNSALHLAVDTAYNNGIVIVAAAGNDYGGAIIYPANYSSVIAVTATDKNNAIASFSNIGTKAELAAPGVSIFSTYKGGTYATLSGTSMATPHVTGAVAVLLATDINLYPGYDLNGDGMWDPVEVRNRLHDTANDLGVAGPDKYFGYGLVNAFNAIN